MKMQKTRKKLSACVATMAVRTWLGLKSHPVELLVLLHATVSVILNGNPWWQAPAYYASFATVAALSLSFFRSKQWVAVAYWAVLPLYALTALLPTEWHSMNEYGLLTALLPAVYLLSRGRGDFNARFFSMARSMVVSVGIGILTYILLMIIIESIQSLFSLTLRQAEDNIASFCFVLLTPMVFVGMESGTEKPIASRLEEALVNWLLTPALLIYNVMLYVYMAMITIRWELPKGSVATMVSVFMGTAVALRWLRPVLQKQPLGWYFRWFGVLTLPLVALFWVAVCYRIGQYGLTIDRCILVATGVLMTAFAGLSLFKTPRGDYWFLGGYAVVGLVMAVGGPLSARQLSLCSQTAVIQQYASKLGMLSDNGTLALPPHNEGDTIYRKEHRAVYQAMNYIEDNLADTVAVRQRLGVTKAEYLGHLSRKTADYATTYWITPEEECAIIETLAKSYSVTATKDVETTGIEGYSKLYTNVHLSDGEIVFGDTSLKADSVLAVQLAKIDYTLESNLDCDKLDRNNMKLCTYRSADGRTMLVFEYFHIESREDGNHMTYGKINCALTKD